jgi:hypothetical protein
MSDMADDFVYSKDGQNFHPMPSEETPESLAEKGYKPYVFLTRDGKPENYYPVPADDNLAKEFASGAQTPQAWNFAHADDRFKDAKLPSELDALTIGIGRGVTSDGLDEGIAGAQSTARELIGRPNNYTQDRDAIRQVMQTAEDVHPRWTTAGQMIGGVGQAVALSTVAPVGAAMRAYPVASGLVSGALQGYGASEADDLPGQALDTAAGGAIGAGAAKAMPFVVEKAIKPAAKIANRVLFGVPKWLTEAYYRNRSKFKDLPEPETVWREAGDIVRKADDNLATAKDGLRESKGALADEKAAIGSHYDTLRDEAKFAYNEAKDAFKIAGARAEGKASEARAALGTAAGDAIDTFRNVQPTAQMAKEIVARHEMQRQITNEMSEAANKALDESGLMLDKTTITGLIDNAIEGLKVPGTEVAGSDKATAAIRSLTAQRARLEALPEELTAVQSRKLMQDLRTDIDFGSRSLEYNAALDNARMKVTEGISAILKEHGGRYADDMADLAARMRMLNNANKYFGDESRAIGSLMLIASKNPKGAPAEETLRQYLGQDFEKLHQQLALAKRAREVLGSGAERSALKSALPEQEAVKTAEQAALRYDPMKLKEAEIDAIKALRAPKDAIWKKEGYELIHESIPERGVNRIVAYDREGNKVGALPFFEKNGALKVSPGSMVYVESAHQRKGIASGMYEMAESIFGKPFKHGTLTGAGQKLWEQSGRRFGADKMDAALRQVIAQGPPEYQAMKAAEKALGQFAPLRLKQLKAKAIMESEAFQAMKAAQELLAQHKAVKDSISDISENGIESLLAASARNKRTLTPKDKLIRLQQAGDEMGMPTRDYIDWAKTNAGNEIFEGGYQNGSANVNLFSLIGGALGGGAAGGGSGIPWAQAAFGAGMGRTVDTFGPRMGRALIDGARKVGNSPTMQDIGRSLPRAATGAMDITPSDYVRQQLDQRYREKLRKQNGE